jgi:predicted Rossmann-fold nucleotide-binding protein
MRPRAKLHCSSCVEMPPPLQADLLLEQTAAKGAGIWDNLRPSWCVPKRGARARIVAFFEATTVSRLESDMPRSRVVIGVIGGGEQQNTAEAIGREISFAGQVVLTGGSRKHSAEVTHATQFGAASVLDVPGVVVRAIGILPSKQPQWSKSIKDRDRSLFLSTGMSHKQRDAINGVTPDVLIALKGGKGTLTEIAFACVAKRPVLLLNSKEHLKAKWIEHRKKRFLGGGDGGLNDYFTQALRVYPKLGALQLSAAQLETDLKKYLDSAEEFVESQVGQVVRRAISLSCDAGVQDRSGFPGLPPDYNGTRGQFESIFQSILGDAVAEFCSLRSS